MYSNVALECGPPAQHKVRVPVHGTVSERHQQHYQRWSTLLTVSNGIASRSLGWALKCTNNTINSSAGQLSVTAGHAIEKLSR